MCVCICVYIITSVYVQNVCFKDQQPNIEEIGIDKLNNYSGLAY